MTRRGMQARLCMLVVLALVLPLLTSAQIIIPPSIAWQRSFGGTGSDGAFGLTATSDGGVVCAGWSASGTNGNKTSPSLGGGRDVFVVRLDRDGNELWQRTFGGSGDESISKLLQLPDGGFLLAGYSSSPTGPAKSGTNYGRYDAWLIRLDAAGERLWDTTYGGAADDYFEIVAITADGGFVAGGSSSSPPGGNKTSPYYGGGYGDYWLVRLDAEGNKLWDQSYGGSADDVLESLHEMPDGGFIVGGWSDYGPNGNRTTPTFGLTDAWILRVDIAGNKIWEQAFGGSDSDYCWSLHALDPETILLAGTSWSGINGNKTSAQIGNGDFWLIGISTNGAKIWEQSIGGTGLDDLRFLSPTTDGGWVMGGKGFSAISGTKTAPQFGLGDYWVVRLDAERNILWDLSFGGTAHEDLFCVQQSADGGYVLTGRSRSGATGNKTTAPFGDYDLWIVKLAPEQPFLSAVRQSAEDVLANGFRLQLTGIGGSVYVTQFSADMVSWSPVSTNTTASTGIPLELLDAGATNQASRFYRAHSVDSGLFVPRSGHIHRARDHFTSSGVRVMAK